MKMSYSQPIDASYIYLIPSLEEEMVEKTYPCNPTKDQGVNGEINLDFDKDGRLLGIEVLDGKRLLSKDLINIICSQKSGYLMYEINNVVNSLKDISKDIIDIYFGSIDLQKQIAKIYRCDPNEVPGKIDLFFDKNGRLIGIRIASADKLAPDLLGLQNDYKKIGKNILI